MNIKELRARLAAVKAEMQGLLDKGLDAETEVQFDELEKEAKTVRGNIDRLERFERDSANDSEPQGRKIVIPKGKVEVRDNATADETAGFENLADFALAVMQSNPSIAGIVDERLQVLGAPSNFHRETGANEGYMVPAQFKSKIFELMFNEPDLLSMVDSEPTSSNTVQFIGDESTPWGSTGIQAYWGGEGNQLNASRLETDGREVKVNKLHAFVSATDELIEDSPRLNNRLTVGAARAMNWKGNQAVLFGTGAGQPLGFDSAASKISVAKESGQAAATITANNVAKMYARSANPGRSVWLANQDALPQMLTMTLGDNAVYMPPSSGFTSAPGGMLFGRPVLFSDHCETVGTNTDIMFVDPMGYYLVRKTSGIKFSSSIHLYFDYDVQAFKWTFRLGGQPYLSAAISPNKGSATRSHYVTLATRA